MATRKCIEKNIMLTCDKGTIDCELLAENKFTNYRGEDLGTSADKVFGKHFMGFGFCSKLQGPCKAEVNEWVNLSDPSVTCGGKRLLNDRSQIYCSVGPAYIKINTDPPPSDIDKLNAIQNLKNNMNGAISKVSPLKMASDQADKLKSGIGSTLGGWFNSAKDVVSDGAKVLADGVSDGLDMAKQGVSDGIDKVKEVGSDIVDGVEELGSDAKRAIGDTIGAAVEAYDEITLDAHIAIGDAIGYVVDGTKEGAEAFVIYAESQGYGNEAQGLVDAGANAAEIAYYFLEADADFVTGLADTASSVVNRVGDYIDDPSKIVSDAQAAGEFVMVNGEKIAVGAYRRSVLNAVLNTDDYQKVLSEDKASAQKMMSSVNNWFKTATPSDYYKLIGKGGFEAVLMAATGGLGSIGVKAVQAKKTIGTVNQGLDAASQTVTAANRLNKPGGQGIMTLKGPANPPAQKPNSPDGDGNNKADDDDTTGLSCAPKGCADPVDAITGVMFYQSEDFEISGIIPINWGRNWYSDSKYKGPMGHGFHHSYDMHFKQKGKRIVLTLKDGRPAFFPILSKENTVFYNRQEKLTLTLINHDGYELFNHTEQLTYTFQNKSNIFRLVKIFNTSKVAINLKYDNGVLFRIIDTAGRIIKIQSNKENRISKISVNHKGKERKLVSYTYNKVGDLISINDALDKPIQLRYKNHLMISKTDRNEQTFYWEYDGSTSGSKCIHTWGDGGILDYRFEYFKDYNTATDSLGNTSTYYYKNNIATKVVDPLGGEVTTSYNKYQELESVINEEGEETLSTYNDNGNLESITHPDGSNIDYTYDEKGRLVIVTQPEGGNVIRSYKNDHLDCIIEPDGSMTTFEYNEKGLVNKVFDNIDNETLLFYDDDHNLIKMKLANGVVSTWEYDEWGQCIASINNEKQKQLFVYDLLGRVSNVKLPDGNAIKLKYNAHQEIIETIDKDRTIAFEYTALGSLKTRTENGTKVYFQYNKEEQLTGIINEHNENYKFSRDAKGNIIKEEGFDGLTRKFRRDKSGKVLKVERPDNKYSIYEYDKASRISRIEHQDGTWSTYNYNKDGLLIEAVNPNSHVKFNRDEAGRIVSENQDGFVVSSEYGELGLRTGIKSNLGANMNFDHSKMGEVTKMIVKTKENKPWEANFLYNSLGMETERALPGGVTSKWNYDNAGLPKQHTINNSTGEKRNRSYSWDVNSKLQKITNNINNGVVRFNYNAFNSLASSQYENGSYDYKLPDEVGNLFRTKNKNDREYGKSGKLLKAGATTYHYDTEGNLIEKNTSEGLWKYTWEAGGMLKSVLKPNRTQIEMEYDALGRRTAKIVKPFPKSSNSKETTIKRWIWDGNVPLHEWEYPLKERPKTAVDIKGNLTKDKKEPVHNLITWVFDRGTFKPAAKITKEDTYSIITDYLGTPVEMYTSKGEKTWAVEYDIYGKIRKQLKGNTEDCPFRYQGQYEDVEIELYYNRFRYYSSKEGVYISQDPIGLAGNNPNIYGYTFDNNNSIDQFGLAKKIEISANTAGSHQGGGDMIGKGVHVNVNIGKGKNVTSIHVSMRVHPDDKIGGLQYFTVDRTGKDIIDNNPKLWDDITKKVDVFVRDPKNNERLKNAALSAHGNDLKTNHDFEEIAKRIDELCPGE